MRSRLLVILFVGALPLWFAPPTQAANEKVFTIELRDGRVVGTNKMQVKHNDMVRWKVKSNENGELHMHAYHIEIPVSTTKVSEYVFKAHATGKFQLEWHPTVKSSSSASTSHHEPLAFLEVYPQ